MHEQVTLLGPQATPGETPRISALPRDLLEQVRGRVRLLAGLMLIGFALDPAIFLIGWTIATLSGMPVIFGNVGFVLTDCAVVLVSLGVWWLSGEGRVSPSRLLTLGLVYEVAICFALAFTAYWQWTLDLGVVPPMTWVPAVIIFFPLVMPGPPRHMLAAALPPGDGAACAAVTRPLGQGHPDWRTTSVRRQLRLRRRVRLHGRESRPSPGPGSRRCARAGELPPRGAARTGRDGRGLAGPAPDAGASAAIKLIRPTVDGGAASDELQRRFERRHKPSRGFARPTRSSCSISAWPTTARSTT